MHRYCTMLMVGSVVALFVLSIIVGRQQQSPRGRRCSIEEVNTLMNSSYNLLVVYYKHSGCMFGDISKASQTPLNKCYNRGMMILQEQEENGNSNYTLTMEYFDQYDAILDYDCYYNLPSVIQETYYDSTDGSCSGNINTSKVGLGRGENLIVTDASACHRFGSSDSNINYYDERDDEDGTTTWAKLIVKKYPW